jgi:hypothetical protein
MGLIEVFVLIVIIFVILLIISIIYITFEWVAFIISFFLVCGILLSNPNIINEINKNPTINYFSIIILISLLLSLENIRTDGNFISILIITAIIGMLSFYTQSHLLIILSMIMNFYIIFKVLFNCC